jgi:type II secretory ATPase GspE/PulE/Tfp pilus assembly ATPase PilB-like protein
MAIRSALTGHLVFSTVHTNDAPSAITRLIDMGIENYLVAAAVKGVLSQRLVRVNCPNCMESYRPAESLIKRAGLTDMADQIDFTRGTGCSQCKDTGFENLNGIFEVIRVTSDLSDMILANASLNKIREVARTHGYRPLFEAGLEKVKTGQVCLEELLKETSNIEEYFTGETANRVSVVHAGTI